MNAALAYPWRLRLAHEGDLSLRLERRGRSIRFDPREAPAAHDIVILTWNWPEHLDATAAAVASGTNPTVVAARPTLDWLASKGSVQGHDQEVELDGVKIRIRGYTPIPFATAPEAVRKVGAGLKSPAQAAKRLLRRARAPRSEPLVVELTFPDGSRLVHLNHALHGDTPPGWLDQAVDDFRGADWLVSGVDFEEYEAFASRIGRFEPKMLLVTALSGEVRRAVGMPTKLLTPLVDELAAQGLDAYVFPSHATFRFE